MRAQWVQRWVTGLPTTAEGVERGFALLVAGLRIGLVAQMLPSFLTGLAASPRPALYAACWGGAAGAALVVTAVSLGRGRALGDGGAMVDLTLAAVILVLAPLTVTPADRVGSWIGFQMANALSVICTSAAAKRRRVWWYGVIAVTGSYVVSLAGTDIGALLPTLIGNELTFVVFAVLCRVIIGYIRRIARDGDAARAEAAELARREEERHAQVLMHNGVAVLRLLSEPGLTDDVRSQLIDQAQVELGKMRAYLRRGAPAPGTTPSASTLALADAVRQTCARYSDLPIEPALDLGADIRLPAADVEAVTRALDSLLLNVRSYARADLVVVHLDADDDGGWSLSVHDDGVGFDTDKPVEGVGLREVVVGEMRRRGYDVEVQSKPGVGTTVTITSAAAPAGEPAGGADVVTGSSAEVIL